MARAQPVRWSFAAGGNHHWYELITTAKSWPDAETAAEALTLDGVQGHLATITSEEERFFIVNNVTSGIAWLGGFQGPGHTEPDGDWELVTGEAFVDFWNANEPNNSPNDSDCMELRDGGFNDRACSQTVAYVVEYDTTVPQVEEEAADLTDPTLPAGSEYGAATAMSADGNLLAVGAVSAQTVDVYRRVANSPATWQLEASLVSPNSDDNGAFGSALAFDPDTAQTCLAVGAPGEDCADPTTGQPIADCGAVHVFCNPTWNLSYTLSPPAFGAVPQPPAPRGMNFGAALAWALTNSTRLVVGAPGRDSTFGVDAGEVFEFTVNSPPELTATLSDLLSTGDLGPGAEFGASVDIANVGSYRIAAGAPGYNTGRVITFLSSSPLAREQIIEPFDGAIDDRFGARVALSSNPHLAVGAPLHNATGAVYLYEFNSPGTLAQKLIGPQPDCEFGASLEISADARLLLVGGPGCSASPLRSGLVFQYFRINPLTLVKTIPPPTAEEDGGFGRSVTLGGNRFAVGEPGLAASLQSVGAATVYALTDRDADGLIDGVDNCQNIANPDQADFDEDGTGDACDSDVDGDGVLDTGDACVPTPLDDVVDGTGCSIGDLCPCDNAWKNQGDYVSCTAHAAESLVAEGLITEAEKDATVSDAAHSSCARKK